MKFFYKKVVLAFLFTIIISSRIYALSTSEIVSSISSIQTQFTSLQSSLINLNLFSEYNGVINYLNLILNSLSKTGSTATPLTFMIGATDSLSTEFSYNSSVFNPEYTIGSSNLSTVRDWIGISDSCSVCYPGNNKSQTLVFNNLEANKDITLKVNAIRIAGSSTFVASIVSGTATIVSGGSIEMNQNMGRSNQWTIVLRPTSTNLSLKLSNNLNSGTSYFYIDSISGDVSSVSNTTNVSFASSTMEKNYGILDSSSSDFTSPISETNAILDASDLEANQMKNIKPWIGFSTCSLCGSNLLTQTIKVFTQGIKNSSDAWVINFTTSSNVTNASLLISNYATNGTNYLYLDKISISPFSILANNSTATSYSSCQTLPMETQIISCPTGQIGSITQSRSSNCSVGASLPTWSNWVTVSSSCATSTNTYIETPITKSEMCDVSFAKNVNNSNSYSDSMSSNVLTPVSYTWDTANMLFKSEKEKYGYNPSFKPGRVSITTSGRPIIRDENFNLQILSDNGTWKNINLLDIAKQSLQVQGISWNPGTFGPIPHSAYANGSVDSESRIVFDSKCNGYTMLWSSPSSLDANILLHTPDGGHSWSAYKVPGTENRTGMSMEVPSSSYALSGPPVLTTYLNQNTYITIPSFDSQNKIIFSQPILITNQGAAISASGGMENYAVSSGDNIYMVYAGSQLTVDPVTGRHGTPAYIVKISKSTNSIIGSPVLIGVGVSENDEITVDNHNQPSIVIDRLGYLHIAIGGHGGPLYYRKSTNPNDIATWEPIERVGIIATPDKLHVEEYTYPSLVVDYYQRPMFIARWSGELTSGGSYTYKFYLVSITRSSTGKFDNQQILLDPGRGFYAHWYHKVSFDPWGRLFISYAYSPNNLYSDEISMFTSKYGLPTIFIDPGCTSTSSTYPDNTTRKYCNYILEEVNRGILISPGYGNQFELATTKNFFKF